MTRNNNIKKLDKLLYQAEKVADELVKEIELVSLQEGNTDDSINPLFKIYNIFDRLGESIQDLHEIKQHEHINYGYEYLFNEIKLIRIDLYAQANYAIIEYKGKQIELEIQNEIAGYPYVKFKGFTFCVEDIEEKETAIY